MTHFVNLWLLLQILKSWTNFYYLSEFSLNIQWIQKSVILISCINLLPKMNQLMKLMENSVHCTLSTLSSRCFWNRVLLQIKAVNCNNRYETKHMLFTKSNSIFLQDLLVSYHWLTN